MADGLRDVKARAAAALEEAGAKLGVDPVEVVRGHRGPENRPPVTEVDRWRCAHWMHFGRVGGASAPAAAYLAWVLLYDEAALLELDGLMSDMSDDWVTDSRTGELGFAIRHERRRMVRSVGRLRGACGRSVAVAGRRGRSARPGRRRRSSARASASRGDSSSPGDPEPPAGRADARHLITAAGSAVTR